jgi:signal transduction histidine kinase
LIYPGKKTTYSKEHTLETIKYALGGMIYNKERGYIFIDDINGISLLQPLNKKIEGQDLSNNKDANGYQYMQKIINTIKDKTENYDEYYWYKTKDDKNTYKKISFYKYFEPYNFAIGTGEYIIDFEKKIQNDLIDRIKEIKFDNNKYIFILKRDGTFLSHFDKSYIETNGLNLKNEKGENYIKDIIEFTNKSNEGFITYSSRTKPSGDIQDTEKISYIRYFEKWDWIIGAGFYLDELSNSIQIKETELKRKHEVLINNILITSLIIMIILLFISFYISSIIEKMFHEYKINIKKEMNNNIKKERLLIQQSKMATMGEMIANIAHQWKQPLSTISTVSTGIKIQKEMNCLQKNDIIVGMENINNSIQYLSQTIEDFRNFFKPDKIKINFKIPI